MSLRRAAPARAAGPAGPVGRPAAAPAGPSLFERTLVKEAINAHLKSMTRRLKREPISQVNPFLVGRQNMIIKELKGGGGGGGGGGGAPPPPPPPAPSAPDPRIQESQDAIQKLEERLQKISDKRTKERDAADQRVDQLQEEIAKLQKALKKGEDQRRKLQMNLARLNENPSDDEDSGPAPAIMNELEKRLPEEPDSEGEVDETDMSDSAKQAARRARGGLETVTLANAGHATVGQAVDIAQLNPWLATFRDRLLKAQEQALKDDDDLRKEIYDYQVVIQELREKLTKSKDEGDAVRTAQAEALERALEEEKKQVQGLMEQLENKSSRAEQFENQWRAVGQQLKDAQQDLAKSEAQAKKLNDDVVRLTVQVAVAQSEIEAMEEKLKEAARMDALTTAEREVLKVQVETAVKELSDMEETLEEFRKAAEKAQEQFDAELARNKTLLEELQTRRATLEKETDNLTRLVDKNWSAVMMTNEI